VSGSIPHPNGEIAVTLTRTGDALDGEVLLPPGVTGEFVWQDSSVPLKAGTNVLHQTVKR
jgi:alpha-L-rhamnosidase